jgi:hypothetical protein
LPKRDQPAPRQLPYDVSGHVFDKSGAGVPGVDIYISPADGPSSKVAGAATDARGYFVREGLAVNGEGYRITPQKGSYEFSPRHVLVTGATSSVRFVMNK